MIDHIELTDLDTDRFLLDAAGISLVIFYSTTCGNCRLVRQTLNTLPLSVQRICWLDAGHSQGLVARYGVFHLPSMFVVRDGVFYGEITPHLNVIDMGRQIQLALDSYPAELP